MAVKAKGSNKAVFKARRRFLQTVAVTGWSCTPWLNVQAQETLRTGARLADGKASLTALGAAAQRALHQIIDFPRIFHDPLAVGIIGADGVATLQDRADRSASGLRAYIAMRSRHAEDQLAGAYARGVRQYALLGAGLDTFASRNPHAGLQVFEVDHPATQQWKRERLAEAGIAPPSSLRFVPVDFETQKLADQLRLSGFRFDEPAFFSMLGVVIYLTREALTETLRLVAGCAPGSSITFSFATPSSWLDDAALARRQRFMVAMAQLGEPWRTFLDPDEVAPWLQGLGFGSAALLTPDQANQRYFSGRSDGLRVPASSFMATAYL